MLIFACARPIYVVTLTPTDDDVPAEIRLRKFLKMALRSYHLRALDVSQTSESGRDTPEHGSVPRVSQRKN